MKHYKQRTIALCLASVMTVVGAFGADNYKNSIKSLRINNGSGGYISLTAYTAKPYNVPVKTVRRDINTYVLVFPETNSEFNTPDINNYDNIQSIDVITTPYTYEKNGYTEVIVKTTGEPALNANTMLFIPGDKKTAKNNASKPVKQTSYWDALETGQKAETTVQTTNQKKYNNASNLNRTASDSYSERSKTSAQSSVNNAQTQQEKVYVPPDSVKNDANAGTSDYMVALVCGLILFLIIVFIVILSKDKMASVIGEQNGFDLNEDDGDKKTQKKKSEKKKTAKKSKIRKTINKLDKTYVNQKKSSVNMITGLSAENPINEKALTNKEENEEDESKTLVVDLDSLYNEKQQPEKAADNGETLNNTESESREQYSDDTVEDDLADFLNEFTFDEEVPEEETFDEKLYEEVINSKDIKFTKEDREKLVQLTQVELSEETQDNLADYKKQEMSKPKPLTQAQILENLVTSYSIKQNISFSKDDINALQKLMSVELDEDFIKDLRTNPSRVAIVEKEISARKAKPHRTSEIMTLNVKDLLPDLSKELKKQGNKRIESEVKPQTVYFSEGYEYTTLSVSPDLGNLSVALKEKGATEHRPSDFMPIAESGYEYTTLSIKDELPDLADVKANPKKYAQPEKKKEKADEKSLLNSLANVTFKPFYEEVPEDEELKPENTDIEENKENIMPEIPVQTIITEQVKDRHTRRLERINKDAQKLLQLIEEQQKERKIKKQQAEEEKQFKRELEQAVSKEQEEKPIDKPVVYEREGAEVLKTVRCNDNTTCSLLKTSDGYVVAGTINGKQKELKRYDKLRTTNMQIRVNEKMKDGCVQYLVKIGANKFVINVTQDSMEFVMDLC